VPLNLTVFLSSFTGSSGNSSTPHSRTIPTADESQWPMFWEFHGSTECLETSQPVYVPVSSPPVSNQLEIRQGCGWVPQNLRGSEDEMPECGIKASMMLSPGWERSIQTEVWSRHTAPHLLSTPTGPEHQLSPPWCQDPREVNERLC
jgi:hypothetical protein